MLGKRQALESAMWAAIVALEEQADLSGRVASRLAAAGRGPQAEKHRRSMLTAKRQASFLRTVITELLQDGAVENVRDQRAGTV